MGGMRVHGQKGVYEEQFCEGLFGPQPCPGHFRQYRHIFDHPIFQTWCMFFGEMICLFVFKILVRWKQRRGVAAETHSRFSCLIFIFPACCDMTASGMMLSGLTMTYASSYQMMRGAVIIFTSCLSVLVFGTKPWLNHWIGMLFVIGGLFVSGVATHILGQENDLNMHRQLVGDVLIIAAQIITAVQVVYEEKVVKKHNIPVLQMVGWEGVWGFIVLGILLVPFYRIPYSFSNLKPSRFENVIDAAIQMTHSWKIGFVIFLLILSVALYNFSGLSVTKEMSATTRTVLDSVRTPFVWAFSLVVKWQNFQYLQPVGYSLLVMGILVYYNLVLLPFILKKLKEWKSKQVLVQPNEDEAPLFSEDEEWLKQPLFKNSDECCKVLSPPNNY
jgi:drug/metabolite transporter (DMT)-like permease